jgi:hypothetical protein
LQQKKTIMFITIRQLEDLMALCDVVQHVLQHIVQQYFF